MLFHTVALIGAANGEFYAKLSAAAEGRVSEAIVQLAEQHLSYYSVFCNHQEEAMSDAKRLQRTSDSFVRICEAASAHADANGLALLDFLVKPFQRLLKYPLLLRELIKYTPAAHAERAGLEAAMAKIQAVVDEVDRNKAKADNLKRMLALNSRISGLPRSIEPLVTPARRVVREGWVRKISSGNDQERHLALFNDMLVYCKRKGADKLLFRDFIWLKELQVTPVDDTDAIQHALQLHRLDKKLTYIIYCDTRLEKTEWHRDFVATQEMLKTLALSQTKYSDNNEYKDCIGAVRIYYEEEGQELFKTFAIGTQVHAADVVRQFATKLRITDQLQELGAELQLQLLSGADASFVPPTASPLAIQLEAIKRGAQFPSPQHRFFVQLPSRGAAAGAATASAAAAVSHMLVDAALSGHSARGSGNDALSQTIDFSLWAGAGGDLEALKLAMRSNTGSSMSISEPSDRAPSTSVDDSESGMGATVDLLDAVLANDNRTLRRVATKAKISLSIPESASERETRADAAADADAILAAVMKDSAPPSAAKEAAPSAAKEAAPTTAPLPKAASGGGGGVSALAGRFGTVVRQPAPKTAPLPEIGSQTMKRAPPSLPPKDGLPPDAASLALMPPTKRAPTRASMPLTSAAPDATPAPPPPSSVDLASIAAPKKRAPVRSSLGSNGSARSDTSPPASPRAPAAAVAAPASDAAPTVTDAATPAATAVTDAATAVTVAATAAPAATVPDAVTATTAAAAAAAAPADVAPAARSSSSAPDDAVDSLLALGASAAPPRSGAEAVAPVAVVSDAKASRELVKSQSTLKRFLGIGKKKDKDAAPPPPEPASEINF
jgi:hypothetical protein